MPRPTHRAPFAFPLCLLGPRRARDHHPVRLCTGCGFASKKETCIQGGKWTP